LLEANCRFCLENPERVLNPFGVKFAAIWFEQHNVFHLPKFIDSMKKLLPLLLLAVVLLFANVRFSYAGNHNEFPKIDTKNVTIVRDSFGIPHIFGKTDADVAYGLAWANAEDAFNETQNLIYVGKGYMARNSGIEGAKADFFVHAIGARKLVNDHYNKDLSPEFKKYLNGFVQGINAYAKTHPELVKMKGAFPITSQDMLSAYVVTMSFLTGAQWSVGDIVSGNYDKRPVQFFKDKMLASAGSNAFALNSTKTVDGKTYLCINPHLYMEGPLSWYEAQLQSGEGLNIEGAMFQGSTSIAMGTNQNLGWGMTWNYFDKLDVYKLKMKNGKKKYYEYDGKWVKLEKRPVWLKVGLGKNHKLVLPVRKMTYWSNYGSTLKSGKSNNFYAVRFPANTTIETGEQLYKMNKAANYKQFWDALRIHALSLFNIVYADKDDNIFYLENGMMPDRDSSFDWSGILPGNSSKTLWTKLVPIDSMPHTINPSCGYVFNTNNTPFHASGEECSQKFCSLPKYVDERPGDNNRAERFVELIGAKNKFSLKDIEQIKFDVTLSKKGKFAESLKPLFNLDETKYPDLKDAIAILKSWNRVAEIHEYAPTILFLTVSEIFEAHHCSDDCFVTGLNASEQEFVSSLRKCCDTLNAHFGTVKVEWGQVDRNIRGNKSLPLRGIPDALSPSYPKRVPGTFTYKPEYGDTYTMFAAFGKNGLEKLEALQPLGNSLQPNSPHYNDQMELFSKQQLRPLNLSKDEVMKKAESVYHPQ
jgi:acyl-homoserine-lactone acylase